MSDMNSVKLNLCYGCMKPLGKETTVCSSCGYDCSVRYNPVDLLPEGTVLFRKYLVGKVIGRGGFGVTYMGYDLDLEVRVAIKEYFPVGACQRVYNTYDVVSTAEASQIAAFAKGCDVFLDESRTLARFNSPYIVHVRDFFREHGTAYIVMDYIDGITLLKEMDCCGGKIPADRLISLMKPLIQQLHELHKSNIIHRDIKPENLMLVGNGKEDEHFVLLDFGTARSFTPGNVTQTYTAVVTPGFAPLEQYSRHSHQGPYSDVYALCATIYKALTGIVPPPATERLADGIPMKSFRSLGIRVPQSVEKAVIHGLEIKSADRTQSMQQLLEELSEETPLPQEPVYAQAFSVMDNAKSSDDFKKAASLLASVTGYRNAEELRKHCLSKEADLRREEEQKRLLEYNRTVYQAACNSMKAGTKEGYEEAIRRFSNIQGFQDTNSRLKECRHELALLNKKEKNSSEEKPKKKTGWGRNILLLVVASVIIGLVYNYSDELKNYAYNAVITQKMSQTTSSNSLYSAQSQASDPYYIVGTKADTFNSLYEIMKEKLDLKNHPIPEPDREGDVYPTGDYERLKIIRNDVETTESIGYIYSASGSRQYIFRLWRGVHRDGNLIEIKVFYFLNGDYLGHIDRDLTFGLSNSSSRAPYSDLSQGTHRLE